MLIDTLRADMILAMKKKDSVRKSILQMLISESSKKTKTPDDAQVVAAAKALTKSNNISLVVAKDEILEEENEILSEYIPASNLSQEEFDNIFNTFEHEDIATASKVAEYRNGNEKMFGFLMGKLVGRFNKDIEKSDIKNMIQKKFNIK